MASSFLDKLILCVGMLSMFHAAVSAAQHHTFLRLTEQEFHIPLDIIVQVLVSLVVTMISVTRVAGDFKEIRVSEELKERTWDSVTNRPAFYNFRHRGVLFQKFIRDEQLDKSRAWNQ
ncbi:unnamed protein product [Notodromas monacha]|uniref:Membrane magnesium transporter n=1 Tax=Notodromas monacha TaxID=399045 RepID=A0A7R9GBF1_9CRUS|nr:unnamed protein product [Notodromas monacha]CAG0916441.1 unnamed protein product [Notodromas monacha]